MKIMTRFDNEFQHQVISLVSISSYELFLMAPQALNRIQFRMKLRAKKYSDVILFCQFARVERTVKIENFRTVF